MSSDALELLRDFDPARSLVALEDDAIGWIDAVLEG